ncbi:Uncharacterised protein [Arcanobacterium haemolyticum]|uniref:Uncharacterized protein n=1 Tax=Arcanobacterium haemolyticum (strain ATCC 9345 / DSM 20595 / CCM 5947 / CCUG 17215 / LMG 16163 / NBRC 15585 / NCTC 8452 / 11018) TaxID=644284 RepID=D7BL75_ARCHD|nr:hypothetical protein Arch_1723 [Arcanobacterium haemolyticum DSM 20595]SQH27679.1 Uncharacterised protein [Arcanobacterium haemolyticum]
MSQFFKSCENASGQFCGYRFCKVFLWRFIRRIRVATTDFEIKAEVDRLAKKFEQEIEGIDEKAFAKLSKELKDSIEKVKTGKADKFNSKLTNPDVKPELIYVTPIVGGVVPNASDPAALRHQASR